MVKGEPMNKLLLSTILVLSFFLLLNAQENDKLIFSHKYHMEEIEAVCTDCHSSVEKSASAKDNLLPDMNTCYNCHDEDDTECTVCHTNPDEAVEEPRIINLKSRFPHQTHLKNFDCITCHIDIVNKENPGTYHIPENQICMDCHGDFDYAADKAECIICHAEQNFNFVPVSHSMNWNKNHGVVEMSDISTCSHCHQSSYCIECHQGDNLENQVHPLNFVNNHGIQARMKNDNCLTCHQEQFFCIDCHNAELVMPKNHSFANWSNNIPGNGGRHAREAKFDMDYCSACHNSAYSDNVCVVCHSN